MSPVVFVTLKERRKKGNEENINKFQRGIFNGSLRRNFPGAVSINRRKKELPMSKQE